MNGRAEQSAPPIKEPKSNDMRTETRTYTLYRITELSEEAKEKAHGEWLCNRYFYGWTYENRQTLDAFCEHFGIVCRNWRYDACNYSYDYRSRQEDCIDSLSGWRLVAYLMNNHWNDLYTRKYFWNGRKGLLLMQLEILILM